MRGRRPVCGPVLIFSIVFAVFAFAAVPAAANSLYASLVIDGNTGADVRARNADSPRYPASLTKIMTLYVLFGEIEAGRVKKSDRITISAHAAAQPPSSLGLKPGETITVEDAMRALVTKSANDVAAAVAEHVAGTEWQFAKRMTETARALGMTKTTFRNASGLPNNEQKTTARDMATLALAIMSHYPEDYKMFRLTSFTWRGQTYRNHNNLLGRYSGTEGIKTGYIRASGYNLVATVRRGDKLAVGVVMGGKSGSSRDAHMRAILDESFPKLSTRRTLPSRPKPALVATAPGAPEPQAAAAPARTAVTRDGVVRLTMVSTPPRSRELPLAEPVSRDIVYHTPADAVVASPIRPTAARSAVMRAAPWPPTAMSAYQVSAASEGTASYAEPDAAGDSDDPIEQLIAAAMAAPPVTASMGDVRVGRLIVPENSGETPVELASEDGGDAVVPAMPSFTPAPEAMDIPAGYQIQVGAYASQDDAQRRIESVQQTADSLLATAMSFTPTVETDAGTFYRARFAGLDKQSANRACSALKKKRIECIVVAQ